MMRRNSITILLFVGLLTLFSCKKESLKGDGIPATIQHYNSGKVYLDNANYSVWHEGDQVLVNTFPASVFDEGGNQWKVNFGENSVASGSMIYALFPYNAAFSINGTMAALSLPAAQSYSVDASGNQLIDAPMAAKGTTALAFYNLCALLRVQVPAGTYVKNIKVSTIEGTAPLAGEATVDYSGDVPVLAMASTGYHTVTLTVENSRADGIYYVCVPPVANKAFKVTVNYRTTESGVNHFLAKTVWTNAPMTIEANQIGPVNMGDFTALRDYLPGIFSVAGDKKVMFSRGNLNINTTTDVFNFNRNQYDITPFPNDGNIANYLINDATSSGNNLPYINRFQNDLDRHWSVLSHNEWNYLVSTRAVNYHRYAFGTVNNVRGLILFPDVFTWPSGVSNQPRTFDAGSSYNNANYTVAQWCLLEEAGCVFLPAGGYGRNSWMGGTSQTNSSEGYYWALDKSGSNVYYFRFRQNYAPNANSTMADDNSLFARMVYVVDAVAK